METISLRCGECSQSYVVGADKAGKRFTCKRCGVKVRVPGSKQRSVETSPSSLIRGETEISQNLLDDLPDFGTSAPDSSPLKQVRPATARQRPTSDRSKHSLIVISGIIGACIVITLLYLFSGSDEEPATAEIIAETVAETAGEAVDDGTRATSSATSPAAVAQAGPQAPAATTVDLPDNAVELARLVNELIARKTNLLAGVIDESSAAAIAEEFAQLERKQRAAEERSRGMLQSEEIKQQIQQDFEPEKRRLIQAWNDQWRRLWEMPGVLDHLHADTAALADRTTIPKDVAGLRAEVMRLMAKSVELTRQVNSLEQALKISPQYRVVSNRLGLMNSVYESKLPGWPNPQVPDDIRASHRALDVELQRISRIEGASYALQYGEMRAEVAAKPAAAAAMPAIETVSYPVPAQFQEFFRQHAHAALIVPANLRDPQDLNTLGQRLQLRGFGARAMMTDGKHALAPVENLDALVAAIDYGTTKVDRTNRVILVTINYPLPELSSTIVDEVLPLLASQQVQDVRDACSMLNNHEPGIGREKVGKELLRLLQQYPDMQHDVTDAIRKGWFSLEQVPQVIAATKFANDDGLAEKMIEGVSRVPGIDRKTIQHIARYLEKGRGGNWLRNIGPPAAPVVHEFATHPDENVRKQVCEVLREIGTEESFAVLEALAADADRGVRDKANESLRELPKRMAERK